MTNQHNLHEREFDEAIESRGSLSATGSEFSNDAQSIDATDSAHILSGWRRILYLSLAAIFFLLGVAGVFLPGLPTTPFLLLTSYFLVRTSPRLNNALMRSRLFGPILMDWQIRGGVRKHVKIKAIIFVMLVVAVTVILAGHSLLPSIAVLVLAAIGITVICRLPTVDSAVS